MALLLPRKASRRKSMVSARLPCVSGPERGSSAHERSACASAGSEPPGCSTPAPAPGSRLGDQPPPPAAVGGRDDAAVGQQAEQRVTALGQGDQRRRDAADDRPAAPPVATLVQSRVDR